MRQCKRYSQGVTNRAGPLKKHHGVSLMELMLASAIGLLVIAGMVQIYCGMKQSQRFLNDTHGMFSSANTLISSIMREVRIAGRMGCEKMSSSHAIYNNDKKQFEILNAMSISESSLRLIHSESQYALLQHDAAHQAYIDIDDTLSLHPGNIILLSDCINSELAIIKKITYSSSNQNRLYFTNPLHFTFNKNTMIVKMAFIEFSYDRHKNIVWLSINNQRTPIVDGIANLLFLKHENSISFEFDAFSGAIRKKWHGYATIR